MSDKKSVVGGSPLYNSESSRFHGTTHTSNLFTHSVPREQQTGRSGHQILIIEEDPALLLEIAAGLHQVGLEWSGVTDAQLSLTSFELSAPDLVLLDATLSGQCSVEICQRIRRASQVPIIVLTEQSESEEQIRFLQMGADTCVFKPISPNLLAARTLAHLRRVHQYDARYSHASRSTSLLSTPLQSTPPQITPLQSQRAVAGGLSSSAGAMQPLSAPAIKAQSLLRKPPAVRCSQAPAGWAVCVACNYTAPRQKFPYRCHESCSNLLICPNCGVEGAVQVA